MFVCLVAAMAAAGTLISTTAAQSNDPSTLPLLTADGLDYVGGFRLPAESVNGDSFSIGGRAMTFNPAGNSLFVSSRAGRVASVSWAMVIWCLASALERDNAIGAIAVLMVNGSRSSLLLPSPTAR